MPKPNLKHLKEKSNEALLDFLKTEVSLGLTFAKIAQFARDTGNIKHYEQCKQNAIAAAEAVDRFKVRLPAAVKLEIEIRASELTRRISML